MVERQAQLIAKWMHLGFIHGVMNTDNMSVAGETIDYGPCAFIDEFSHNKVFSSIDHGGRYAYSNQPGIGLWNLTRFAETLLPLLADDLDAAVAVAKQVLESYPGRFEQEWLAGFRAKCGLNGGNHIGLEKDKQLIEDLLDAMAENSADFTLTFFHLSRMYTLDERHEQALRNLFNESTAINNWLAAWRARLRELGSADDANNGDRQAAMRQVNPVYIPRNHQIEAVIRAAEDHNDFTLFNELHTLLRNPFEVQTGKDRFMQPPEPDEVVRQTFCGT